MNAPSNRYVLSGILNIDKPLGLTSHDVVVKVRQLAKQRKVGHAGTLDPLATGVLLVCLGRATRVTEYLMNSPKTYLATVHLGISTTTHDKEGEIVNRCPVDVTQAQIETALQTFMGHIRQIPPMHSAIKIKGKKLYKLARQGITIERPPREVRIDALQIQGWSSPLLDIKVQCGPGTYIRALARDLGQVLGCGAHLCALRRTQSGQFLAQQATTLAELEQTFAKGTIADLLYPLDVALYRLPAFQLDAAAMHQLIMGQPVHILAADTESPQARAYGPDGQFIALIDHDQKSGNWKPRKVFISSNARSDR